MQDAHTPPLQQLNRTLIGSVLFLDIVEYSTRTVPDQIAMKEQFIALLSQAVENMAPAERIVVDSGDGAAIAFLGDPEDALFAALSLRDAIDAGKAPIGEPGFVRMGINLGPLKVVRDINGHTNMIGDGVNDAQRVMSFAEPGQFMVSRAYYDIISRFSHDYERLFVYEGVRRDKHVREHEVYRFGPQEETEELTTSLRNRSLARHGPPSADITTPPLAKPPRRMRWLLAASAVAIVCGAILALLWPRSSGLPPAPPAPVRAVAHVPTANPVVPVVRAAAAHASPRSFATPAPTLASMVTTKPAPAPVIMSKPKAAEKPGAVEFAIQPWGEVFVDGIDRGASPPLHRIELSPGRHAIVIRNGQLAPFKTTVDIRSAHSRTIRHVF